MEDVHCWTQSREDPWQHKIKQPSMQHQRTIKHVAASTRNTPRHACIRSKRLDRKHVERKINKMHVILAVALCDVEHVNCLLQTGSKAHPSSPFCLYGSVSWKHHTSATCSKYTISLILKFLTACDWDSVSVLNTLLIWLSNQPWNLLRGLCPQCEHITQYIPGRTVPEASFS